MRRTTAGASGQLSLIALAALALFGGIVALQHALHANLGPDTHTVSEYANVSPGWLMKLGFAAWAAAFGFSALIAAGFARRAGFALAAVGAMLLAAFDTQAVAGSLPSDAERTLAGRLHDCGGELVIAGLAISAGSVLLSRAAPRRLRVATVLLAPVPMAAALVLWALGDPAPGLRQRLLIASAVAWHALLLAYRGSGPGHAEPVV